MRRPIPLLLFPILAATAGLSWLARLVAGLASPADVPAVCDPLAIVSTYGAHWMAQRSIGTWELKIRAKAEAEGLPDWVGAQAEKNFGKASLLVWSGFLLLCLAIWSWADGHRGLMSGARLDGLVAFNLAFQVGAFAAEYVAMTAQGRLLRDVEGWVAGSGPSENESATPAVSIIVKSADR
jgi:hypothetical protein